MSQVYDRVANILVEALNVDEGDVTPEATLQSDLGAESIDFLDIVFRLEREFNIKIPRGELFPDHIFQENPDCVVDGKVTPIGIEKLKVALPHADFSNFEKDPAYQQISGLFTVGALTRYVEGKIAKAA